MTAHATRPLTQVQAAAVVGVTTRTMQKLEEAGEGPPRDENGAYPPSALGEWMRKRAATSAKERLTDAQADIAEMEAAELRGELGRVAECQAWWSEMAGNMRSRLLNLPSAGATLVVGEDRAGALTVLRRLVNEALSELSDDGVPPRIRERVQARMRATEAAAGTDGEPMGGPPSSTVQ